MVTPLYVLCTYPRADASRRLRIDPLLAHLGRRGWQIRVHTVFSDRAFRWKNRSALFRLLAGLSVTLSLIRRAFVLALMPASSVVLVHREAYPFFTPLAERLVAARARSFILDVDDALWASPTHGRDWRRHLREPEAYDQVLGLASFVIAGNHAVAERARGAGTDTAVEPTLPAPSVYALRRKPAPGPTLLWTGSFSTLRSLKSILPELLESCSKINGRLVLLGGDNVARLAVNHPALSASKWSQARELMALRSAWIGLMPLPDTEWERGKSAYKCLLYMAAGLPSIVSPVGMSAWLAETAPGVWSAQTPADWASAVESLQLEASIAEGKRARAWLNQTFPRSERFSAVDRFLPGPRGPGFGTARPTSNKQSNV